MTTKTPSSLWMANILGVGQVCSWGSLYYSFPLLAQAMGAELHWSKSEIFFGATISMLVTAVFTYPVGLAIDRGYGRWMMSGASLFAALMLWWLPARIQLCWLMFIFAWYPHHPANETSRYRNTRVAVFRGSGVLIRGHDHHAMHHLFPRVPHYRLKALWRETASDFVAKGVRVEGRAAGATSRIVW